MALTTSSLASSLNHGRDLVSPDGIEQSKHDRISVTTASVAAGDVESIADVNALPRVTPASTRVTLSDSAFTVVSMRSANLCEYAKLISVNDLSCGVGGGVATSVEEREYSNSRASSRARRGGAGKEGI